MDGCLLPQTFWPSPAGKGKEEAKDFMGGFGLGSVVEQLADLKLGADSVLFSCCALL